MIRRTSFFFFVLTHIFVVSCRFGAVVKERYDKNNRVCDCMSVAFDSINYNLLNSQKTSSIKIIS